MKKLFLIITLLVSANASAMELDWSGQFRSEFNVIKNYTLDSSDQASNPDTTRQAAHGYYIAPAGNKNAEFQTLFLKLRPKLVVNDNVYIKSELWLGDPTFGFYGGGSPYSMDQKYYNSTYSRGATVSAQRVWAEFLSDFGTLQVGRTPLQYGLGLNWDAGDNLWSHYESTGDSVRLISKFGAFSFIPAAISYSTGNTIGGACQFNVATGTCSSYPGEGGLSDYSLQVKYENPDEDFEGGVNFIRRIAGGGQDPNSGYGGVVANPGVPPATPGGTGPNILAASSSYNTFDIYMKKKAGRLTLAAEVPVVSGNIGGVPYSTWALAAEVGFKQSDTWEFTSKFGHAPGQPGDVSATPGTFKEYYFHPNYQIGLIMFNYQFHNFAGPNTTNNPSVLQSQLASPYDNPITNANYINLTTLLHAEKWTFDGSFVYAKADQACSAGSAYCWNTWERRMVAQKAGDQSKSLGWEIDLGAAFQYDETFNFRLDAGLYVPGQFYAYSNVAGSPNATSTVEALVGRIGVNF